MVKEREELPPDLAEKEKEHERSGMVMVASAAVAALVGICFFVYGVMEKSSWAEIVLTVWASFLVVFVGILAVVAILDANREDI